jgi:hypothetical protein
MWPKGAGAEMCNGSRSSQASALSGALEASWTALCGRALKGVRHEVQLIPSAYVKLFVKRDRFQGQDADLRRALPQADFRSGFAALAPPLAFTSAAWSLTVCSA